MRLFFVAFGVLAVSITTFFAIFGLFRYTRLVDVKFPVVVIRADGSHAFAASDPELIIRPGPDWTDAPEDGAVLIDADFKIYDERNVRRPESELGWLARRYTTWFRPAPYKMDLRRRWRSGLVRAQAKLAACQSFAGTEDAGLVRWEIAQQTTMAGIAAVVNRGRTEPPGPVAATGPAELREPFETES
ncbi:MAG: hypothetical protein JWM57_2838, partial [Phycisphaerales bacterium]|nr:hypothetical protein [Phycisphaerales bacterium]